MLRRRRLGVFEQQRGKRGLKAACRSGSPAAAALGDDGTLLRSALSPGPLPRPLSPGERGGRRACFSPPPRGERWGRGPRPEHPLALPLSPRAHSPMAAQRRIRPSACTTSRSGESTARCIHSNGIEARSGRCRMARMSKFHATGAALFTRRPLRLNRQRISCRV